MKVLVSRGFGAGFSTWTNADPTDKTLIELIESKQLDEAKTYCRDTWGEQYWSGIEDCVVEEVPSGALWRINEYDGSESLEIFDAAYWNVSDE